jgi:hypothetical protein
VRALEWNLCNGQRKCLVIDRFPFGPEHSESEHLGKTPSKVSSSLKVTARHLVIVTGKAVVLLTGKGFELRVLEDRCGLVGGHRFLLQRLDHEHFLPLRLR